MSRETLSIEWITEEKLTGDHDCPSTKAVQVKPGSRSIINCSDRGTRYLLLVDDDGSMRLVEENSYYKKEEQCQKQPPTTAKPLK